MTSTAAVADRILESNAAHTALRVAGRGSWLDAGRPVQHATPMSLAELTGVVEYTPGDLTITVRAGTSLAEIERVTAGERQWLALDPPGAGDGTIGATIATASAGPLAHAFGSPRDHVLGLEVVTGTGVRITTGGRVVKNVAGFDLTRLFTGSWGTLGVITEVTMRLRGLPERDETVAVAVDDGASNIEALATKLRGMAIAPIALELLNTELARRLSLGKKATLLARLAGNGDAVRSQRAVLASLGSTADAPADAWTTLRRCEPAGSSVLRLSRAPSHIAEMWALAHALGVAPLAHASLGRGVVRVMLSEPDANFAETLRASSATVIAERLPGAAWNGWSFGALDPLSHRVKRRYDPANVLNPGILGGGA
ncbi:MAG: FAD-binding protein [Gemmatimonadota bacterium]|nr:FAD-binding protein [Gemmatimonadota bacterium]